MTTFTLAPVMAGPLERGKARENTEPWPCMSLGEVCDINPKRTPSIDRPDKAPTSFVPMAAVDGRFGTICGALERPFGELRKGFTYFEDGDVIFAKITPCMQNGKHAICRGLRGGFGFGSTEFHVIRPGPRITAAWVHFYVRRPEILDQAVHALTGSAGQQRLPELFLQNLSIPLPPLVEQERIAAQLTEQLAEVERARAATQARLDAAESLPAACLRKAFGDAACISASPIVPSTSTRPGWDWHRLTDLARLATGHTPSRREPAWWGGDVQWLQLPDIRAVDGRRVLKTLEQTNELGISNSSAVLLPEGTVCMSRTASVGFVAIMGRAMATSQDFVNWVCGPALDPDFLMYLLIRSRRELRDMGSGATHHSIYFETVENFSVCTPPVADQRRIAADLALSLAGADRLLEDLRAELGAISALPAALLREAFQESH